MTRTAPGVSAEYLRTARDAGVLGHLDGRPFVAGLDYDEAGGERQCVVEYCHPQLLCDGAERLAAVVSAQFPTAEVLVLRTPGDIRMPPPWLAHLTYVRFVGASPVPPDATVATVTVSPADRRHDGPILGWLVRAFEGYGDDQHHSGGPDEILAAARRVLDAPDRRSYVAVVDGVVVGHVTLLCDAYDDVAVGCHVELLDVLVDAEPPLRGAALGVLTAAAVAHANRLGLPMLGHVVHPTAEPDRARGEDVVRTLLERGWIVDHRYWRRGRPADEATRSSST